MSADVRLRLQQVTAVELRELRFLRRGTAQQHSSTTAQQHNSTATAHTGGHENHKTTRQTTRQFTSSAGRDVPAEAEAEAEAEWECSRGGDLFVGRDHVGFEGAHLQESLAQRPRTLTQHVAARRRAQAESRDQRSRMQMRRKRTLPYAHKPTTTPQNVRCAQSYVHSHRHTAHGVGHGAHAGAGAGIDADVRGRQGDDGAERVDEEVHELHVEVVGSHGIGHCRAGESTSTTHEKLIEPEAWECGREKMGRERRRREGIRERKRECTPEYAARTFGFELASGIISSGSSSKGS